MFSPQFLIFFFLFTMLHIFVNIFLTKEIITWVLETQQRVILITLVWCIPIIGAIHTSKVLGRDNYSSGSRSSSFSAGLIGMDEIFNPSTKYAVETQQEENFEVRENDEPYIRRESLEQLIIKCSRNDASKDV